MPILALVNAVFFSDDAADHHHYLRSSLRRGGGRRIPNSALRLCFAAVLPTVGGPGGCFSSIARGQSASAFALLNDLAPRRRGVCTCTGSGGARRRRGVLRGLTYAGVQQGSLAPPAVVLLPQQAARNPTYDPTTRAEALVVVFTRWTFQSHARSCEGGSEGGVAAIVRRSAPRGRANF